MMGEHYIEECRVCAKIIAQCRCPAKAKTVYFSTCNECKEKGRKKMLKILIVNDGTGDEINGNYDAQVFIAEKKIYQTRIEGHNRLLGWPDLVQKIADKVAEDQGK